jgi:HemK-like putative methylase
VNNSGANLASLLGRARRQLAGLPAGQLEAEVLLAHVLGVNRAWLFAHPEREIPADEAAAFIRLLARRERGEPLAYLTGTREFWSLSLRVTPDVLIPRPETELLVETALRHIPEGRRQRRAARRRARSASSGFLAGTAGWPLQGHRQQPAVCRGE